MSLTTISLVLSAAAIALNLWVFYRRHCDDQAKAAKSGEGNDGVEY